MTTPKNGEQKGSDKVLKLNNFYEKGIYAITINPLDKYQYFGNDKRLSKCRSFVNEELLYLKQIHINYSLYLEISEPTSNDRSVNGPRIHFHGIIEFKATLSIKNFLLTGWYKLSRWSIFKINKITDIEIWKDYCTKQQHIIKTPTLSNFMEDADFWRIPEKGESDKDKADLLET